MSAQDLTVTVVRVARGRGGDPVGPPAEHQLTGCSVSPRTASRTTAEPDDVGETVIVGLTLYGPFDADLLATDQVQLAGSAWDGTYDVVGDPGRWQSPFTGRRAGMEAALTRQGSS